VAVSAGGVYRTEDGGKTWQARNNGVRVVFMPEKYPEFGQCVHKIVLHESRPERLFLQNHWGLYRSDNRGDSWQDIARGVPSDFGFAMLIHPHDANCVYIVPVESDELLDDYTNRPFEKVFEGIRRVEEFLQPVFTAAGSEPFKAGSQVRARRQKLERAVDLSKDSQSKKDLTL
jgi:hypothetical protein